MRFRAEALLHCLRNAQPADTRLARDRDDTTVASFRLRPAPHQKLDLFFATDQRRCCRAQGFSGLLVAPRPGPGANPVILY
jgi:hypothetical protein